MIFELIINVITIFNNNYKQIKKMLLKVTKTNMTNYKRIKDVI